MRPMLLGRRVKMVLVEREHLQKRVDYINDPEVQATLNFDFPTSLAKTEAWFSRNLLAKDRIDFAIHLTSDNRIVGFGGLINISIAARKAELYIFIGDKKNWGKGIGRDGYKLLCNYGFSELGLSRIYLFQLTSNKRAIKATEQLGWTTEGLLRSDIFSHGQLKDQYIVSILRSEWENCELYDDV